MGAVLFRGTMQPSLADFNFLADHGVDVEPVDARGHHWCIEVTHPTWGKATVLCMRDMPPPPRHMLELDPRLDADDVEAIAACGASVSLSLEGKHKYVLRDRKHLLRFMRLLMGDDGVAAVDHTAGGFWTRQALDDELAHDADLDVQHLFMIHAVYDDDPPRDEDDQPNTYWLHTHGLAELGAFDYDIVDPHPDVKHCGDLTRALAFMVIEGAAKADSASLKLAGNMPPVRMVPAEQFMKQAPPRYTQMRDDPDGEHRDNRAVVCDVKSGGLFRKGKVRPAKWLSKPVPDELILNFSNAATQLMADRARNTYAVLRSAFDQFREFEFPALVKLGYVVDGGGEHDREHLWFIAHELHDDHIDGTLINQPFGIARFQEGQRDTHDLKHISDWQLMTPAGHINPRSFSARRVIEANREQIRAILAQQGD